MNLDNFYPFRLYVRVDQPYSSTITQLNHLNLGSVDLGSRVCKILLLDINRLCLLISKFSHGTFELVSVCFIFVLKSYIVSTLLSLNFICFLNFKMLHF